jgi:hypothetical protein
VITYDSPEDVLQILDRCGVHDANTVTGRGLNGLQTTIIALLSVATLSNSIIHLSRLRDSGIVVDTRPSRIVIKRDDDLPRGTVLVISSPGTETKLIEPSEMDLKPLFSGLKASE